MSAQPSQDEPQHLCCPVTHSLYEDPVVTMGGNTYERSAILAYWEQRGGDPVDPLTNTVLPSRLLIPNWDKRREIQDFLETLPSDSWIQ
eukprot:TRINITY_DN14029_c4_g1_i1.p1 TRINITY_DN14029_c4_g1~~TRINITY_DN14029_c4_g1_i1.p1  ORF type:complete len:100 (-),score=10.61 TRINITY_DN14029_c4_g1_i1:76-342(-)